MVVGIGRLRGVLLDLLCRLHFAVRLHDFRKPPGVSLCLQRADALPQESVPIAERRLIQVLAKEVVELGQTQVRRMVFAHHQQAHVLERVLQGIGQQLQPVPPIGLLQHPAVRQGHHIGVPLDDGLFLLGPGTSGRLRRVHRNPRGGQRRPAEDTGHHFWKQTSGPVDRTIRIGTSVEHGRVPKIRCPSSGLD